MLKIFIIFILLLSSVVYADPPSNVARLSYLQGMTSFSPVGGKVWVKAQVNRPLVPGDQLWADDKARAEIQLGGAVVRIEDGSSLRLLNLNDRVAQFHLPQGTLILRVRYMTPDQTYEIDTPNLAFIVRKSGNYRIDVDPDTGSTTVHIRDGRGTVYSKNKIFPMRAPQSFRFVGPHFINYQVLETDVLDSFDRWSLKRDAYTSRSQSARYVSTTMVGYEDLDNYGSWRYVPDYGNVWMPRHVSRGWAPYRNGHWAWITPWGWTWIDNEPWGFAPSHYGRWAYYRDAWVWIPGPRTQQAHYAPALVVFISHAAAGIAWLPLGPRDVYIPPYQASQDYFTSVNVSNTNINNTQIMNVYNNNTTVQNNYINSTAPNAVTAVPVNTFTQAKPVATATVPLPQAKITTSVTPAAPPEAPTAASTIGTATTTDTKPPEKAMDSNPTVVVTPPAPAADSKSTAPAPTVVQPPEPTIHTTPAAPDSSISEQLAPNSPSTTNTSTDKPATAGAIPEAPPPSTSPTQPAPASSASSTKLPTNAIDSDPTVVVTPPAPASGSESTAPAPTVVVQPTEPTTHTTPAAPDSSTAAQPTPNSPSTTTPATVEPTPEALPAASTSPTQPESTSSAAAEINKANADKAAADQQAAEKAAQEKAQVDKAAAEQQATEKAAQEKAEADKAAAQQQAASEKAAAEQQAAAEKAAQEKAEADKAAVEKAAREKAEADKAAAQAVAPNATTAPK
jgi:hypothetical protein